MAKLSSNIAAWKILDRIRGNGHLSHDDFILALTILIFLRWADFQEAELEAMASFDEAPYEPVLPASLHWRTWHQLHPHELTRVLTEHVSSVLYSLKNSRHNPLATHLHSLAGPLEKLAGSPGDTFYHLVMWLVEQPFETPTDRRQLLNVFDDLLEAPQNLRAGFFKTPQQIVRLMVELAAPVAGERVYDPCCGSAGFLTMAHDYTLRNDEQKRARSGGSGLDISGVEINESAYIIAMTRLALAGIEDPKIEWGNSLERTPPTNPMKDGFDVVIANPPWGWTAKIEPYGLEHYPIMTKDSTGLFIQHALAQLRPNGRAVIAVPQGILFRGGAERALREWLIEQHTIEAIISLPETTFLPLTSIKSSILVLRRGGTTKSIRMLDAEPFFERSKGKQSAIITEIQTGELVKKVHDIEPSDCCWDVDITSLVEANFDLTPQRRDQSNLMVVLETIRSEVPLVQLKECCQVIPGSSIRAADLIDVHSKFNSTMARLFPEPQDIGIQQQISKPDEIPYIRTRDINRGQANRSSSWISAEATVSIEKNWTLRAGDVLLSKSGTIGKVGIVRNGAVGGVAASSLYVLRPDMNQADPHYLAAYLDSSECRAWLNDRASGAVIKHLTKSIIAEIPVPLPSLQIQQRIADESNRHGVDALAFLTELLTGDKRDPIAEWIETELKNLSVEIDKISDSLDFTLLDQMATRVRPLRNEAAHGFHGENTLVPWLLAFHEAISILRGVSKIPHGPGLLSLLQESAQGIKRSEDVIKGHMPSEGNARKLTRLITSSLARGIAALLDKVQLVFSIEDSTLRTGDVKEFDLKVQNNSPLPLRELEIFFEPEWGRGRFQYFAENSSLIVGLKAIAPKVAGQMTLNIRWLALKLDGQQVDGSTEIAFDVLSEANEPTNAVVDLGGSPYVCGDPIRPERNDVFFGREELISQIRRQIVQSGNVVLLEGNRRSGKTSILSHLEGIGPVPGWLGIYCSLQGAEGSKDSVGVPTAAVFREIASSIAKGLVALGGEIPLPDGSVLPAKQKIGIAKACRQGISEESPFTDFRDYIEVVLAVVEERNLGILLMLDEFDKLQEGIDNGVTSPQVPENIRYLVQTYSKLSVILTGSRRLKRLREEYWSALYGLGIRFGVTSLPDKAASKLVTEPVKGILNFSRESVDRAISLTNRQPYLLQCLCNWIFNMTAQLKTRSVTLDLVEQAADLLAENNEHFASLWDYARSDRRRFILGLIHKEEAGPDPLRFGVLLELLSHHGVEVKEDILIADLEFLRELELIDLVGESGGKYVLSIPLMGRWIDRQHDFMVLRKKAQIETEDHDV